MAIQTDTEFFAYINTEIEWEIKMKKSELLAMLEELSLDGKVVFEVENMRFYTTDFTEDIFVTGRTPAEITLKVVI